MNKRLKCATLLAMGGVVLAGGSSVGAAAPIRPCQNGDKLITVTVGSTLQSGADSNGNSLVCESTDRSHGTKKKGPGGVSYSYYDDTV